MMVATITITFIFYLILPIPDRDRGPMNLFFLFMGPFYIGAILHLLIYYHCPYLEINKEGLRKQKYFLSRNQFMKRTRFIPFTTIKSIQLKDIEKSMWVEQAPYLALEMKDGQEKRVYLKIDNIPEIKKILKDNFRSFKDVRKHREEEQIPEIESISTEKTGAIGTKMVEVQCPQCSKVIYYREDREPWVIKCPNCSYEPERAIVKWLYLLDQNDEVFDMCPKCEQYTQISAENKEKHVQFTCKNCDYKFIIDKRGGILPNDLVPPPPIP